MYQVKNYMEVAVSNLIDGVVNEISVCKCEKCIMDIIALTLNDLKPRYFVTQSGEIFTKISMLEEQYEVDIISAIAKAAIWVKRNPRHE